MRARMAEMRSSLDRLNYKIEKYELLLVEKERQLFHDGTEAADD